MNKIKAVAIVKYFTLLSLGYSDKQILAMSPEQRLKIIQDYLNKKEDKNGLPF